MHQNRLIYTLPEYQRKLRNGYKKLGLFMQNIEDSKVYCFRPVPSTQWLPEGRNKYFRKIQRKLENINQTNYYSFATLTYSASRYSPIGACKRIKHDIDLFFKRLGYHHRKFEFFYVIELTKNYMPHVHIIFDKYIPHSKLKASWHAVTNNLIVDIRKIPSKQAFYYCVKYLNDAKKQSTDKWSFIFSHIDRIWTASRNFFAAAESKTGKYKFLFMAWDPEHTFDQFFNNPDKDLIGDRVSYDDAVIIAGFSDRFDNIKVMSQNPDFCFYSFNNNAEREPKYLRVTPDSFQKMFDFYKVK